MRHKIFTILIAIPMTYIFYLSMFFGYFDDDTEHKELLEALSDFWNHGFD